VPPVHLPASQVSLGPDRLAVRFVCPGDPSRAFIAAAFVRDLARGAAESFVQGDLRAVHPAAHAVMEEIGVSLAGAGAARPRAPAELVVSIRNRGLPAPPDVMSWSFDDPTAADARTTLHAFRRVRDEIKRRVDLLLLVKRIGGRPAARS
jgi:protein-tyrosine-phosphatase